MHILFGKRPAVMSQWTCGPGLSWGLAPAHTHTRPNLFTSLGAVLSSILHLLVLAMLSMCTCLLHQAICSSFVVSMCLR